MTDKPELKVLTPPAENLSINIPDAFDLDKFKVKTTPNIAGVDTLQTALKHHSISQAKDFVRLHPSDDYWSPELCFVNVPIKGSSRDTLHLIVEELAVQFLPSAMIQRFRLALASKPFDRFFLCHVPSRKLENSWNSSNLLACEQARPMWIMATSRREEGVEGFKIDQARDPDAFDPPNWPAQTLTELIGITFAACRIERADHPGLLRLIGARQSIS